MSLTHPNTPVSQQDLKDFYNKIKGYLGYPVMPSEDMSEVVSPLPSVPSKYPVLFDESGAERVVGWYKYSNGTKKPVYEKTVNFGAMPNNTAKDVSTGLAISSISKFVKVEGMSDDGNNFRTIPYVFATSVFHGIIVWANTNTGLFEIKISTNVDRSTENAFVTIQYTKTSDTAQ